MINGKNYEINKENILYHELIGLNVKVVESSDPKKIGINGKIIDETKNTFILENKKIIPKKECIFEFDLNEKIIVDGKMILKKPENRIK
ncbi:MAG: ribonuclease P protein component 1 [Candidatus ainarchaeum sp.]|nr:ribonuclease P protein component 1 [Candidatus ainarchaeum sp.]